MFTKEQIVFTSLKNIAPLGGETMVNHHIKQADRKRSVTKSFSDWCKLKGGKEKFMRGTSPNWNVKN